MRNLRTFKNSLLIGFLLATILPMLFLGYFTYSYLSNKMEETGLRTNELLSSNVAFTISAYLHDPLSILQQVNNAILVFPQQYDLNLYLNSVVEESDFLEAIYLIDKRRTVQNIGLPMDYQKISRNFLGLDFSRMSVLQNIEYLQGPLWSESMISPITGKKNLALVFPTTNGRAIIGVFNKSLLQKLIEKITRERSTITIVLDDTGRPVYHPDRKKVEERYSYANLEPFKKSQLGIFGSYSVFIDNKKYIVSTTIISETKWLVLSLLPYSIAEKPIKNMTVFFFFAVLFSILIVAALAIRQSERLLYPLTLLHDNIQALTDGKYHHEIPTQSHKEFERLANHFRSMSSVIERRERLLELNEERLISLLELHNIKQLEVDELITFALERAVTLTKSEIGYIYFPMEKDFKSGEVRWSTGVEDFCEKYPVVKDYLSSGNMWKDSIEEKTFQIRNVDANDESGGLLLANEKPGEISVPIFDDKKLVAVIGTLGKQEDYTINDARQLELYFNHTWDILLQKKTEQEKKRLSEQLAYAQKLEAIGTLAGGIAHDFNNVLMVIVGNTEMAKDNIENPDLLRKDLNEIFSGAMRAKDLVNQILSFSRNQKGDLKPFDISPVVKECVKLLRASIPANFKIRQNITNQSKMIISEPAQIKQLVMNLCTNGYQAMEELGAGVLEISLDTVRLNEDRIIKNNEKVRAGEYMLLQVSDNGVGIPEEKQKRIFDPYFTTREKERGTGLGLSVVHGIVKNLNGSVIVESYIGKGTTFSIYIPVVETKHTGIEQVVSSSLPGGDEHILYVDDDESVASVNCRILRGLGYQVTEMTSSVDAYSFYKEKQTTIDLVITDMAMPDMTGKTLASAINKLNDTPIILCTGYSGNEGDARAKELGVTDVLLKPVTKVDLALTVRKVLGYK